jgi:hypothetical protein
LGCVGARHRTYRGRRAGRWSALGGACIVLGALAAAPAQAATGTILGSPLTVYANDSGQIQVAFPGAASGEFYTGALMPNKAGVTLAIQTASANAFVVYGIRGGNLFTPLTAPTVTGNGSAASPWILHTTFQAVSQLAGPLATVDETIVYVNGTTQSGIRYTVSSTMALSSVRMYESGDILPGGGYPATGFVTGAAPTRRVGGQGLYNGVGGSGSILEIDPWSHFQEAAASVIDNAVSNVSLAATGLNDTVNPGVASNGAGVAAQWELGGVNPTAGPVTRSTAWYFSRTSALDLAASGASVPTGNTATVTVAARTNDGAPDVGRSVPYTITGANPSSGAVTTAADGTTAISWLGSKAGTDTLTAFADPRRQRHLGRQHRAAPDHDGDLDPGRRTAAPAAGAGQVGGREGRVRARSSSRPAGLHPAGAATGRDGLRRRSRGRQHPGGLAAGHEQGPRRVDLGGRHRRGEDSDVGLLPGPLPGQADAPEEEAQEAQGAHHRSGHEGAARAFAVRAAEGRALRRLADTAKKKKKGPKSVLGKLWGSGRASSARTASTAPRRCAGRSGWCRTSAMAR